MEFQPTLEIIRTEMPALFDGAKYLVGTGAYLFVLCRNPKCLQNKITDSIFEAYHTMSHSGYYSYYYDEFWRQLYAFI